MILIKKLEKNEIRAALKIIVETRAATKIKEAKWLIDLSLRKELQALKPAYYVLLKDKKIVGISGLYQDYEDPNTVRWLDYLAVTPKLQRKGYGTIMLENLEKICRSKKVKLLCVFTDNQKAINFYQKHKFKIFGKIPNYFSHSDAKIWLYKKL